jgi:hypothetical protein
MALKKINENPKISDIILFEITTPGADGCFDANPYKVDSLIVYYVERDFLGSNFGEYTKVTISDQLQTKLNNAEKAVCDNPSLENVIALEQLKAEINSAQQKTTFYYKDRTAIKVVGTRDFPAWLSSDVENAFLKLEPEDPEGNLQYGRFTYEWNPNAKIREGDYFVCWTWTPLPDGEKLSAHLHFTIEGDGHAVSTIPTHVTAENKYETLLERYLPELYKYTLANQDITPQTTEQFNLAVAKGFTFIEDMANQLIDLFDANALHESMLAYLSNLFSIKLRSSDSTLWRRQIKEAVPLFKKKGTLGGLEQAFAQSGMTLNSFTQYWQLVSPYTWVQVFKVAESLIFDLDKDTLILPLNLDNFSLELKRAGTTEYVSVSSDNVTFQTGDDGIIRMSWIGDQLSMNSIDLYQGDMLKVMYQFKEINSPSQQAIENYVRLLPLMDQRNEEDQEYPLKNWNVRLIDEQDPLFDILIPVKHPFHDPLQFGWYRTEFAYSENIYNAEEYNGSTRPSFDACRIDKNFIDPCGSCLSSSYSVDIGVEELSNDRMFEAQEILKEFTPFHAEIHTINFTGEVNEFIQSPVEQIDTLITIDYSQFVLSGNSNPFFNRNMDGALSNWIVTREDLAEQITVLSGHTGLAYNDRVIFIAPDFNLQSLGIIWDNHLLQILSPSANTGEYTIDNIEGSIAHVASPVIEPLDKSAFTFRLVNVTFKSVNSSISQDNLIKLSDEELNLSELSIRTNWDVENTPNYNGGSWKVLIPAYSATAYEIKEIVDGFVVLIGDSNLPNIDTTNVSYSLLNELDEIIETSTKGILDITQRGYVNLNENAILNIEDFIKLGDFLYYNGNEYLISGFDGLNFWIEDYVDGDAVGVTLQTRRVVVEKGTGYFGYRGLKLITSADHEAEFEMIDVSNTSVEEDIESNSHFKENYLFKIGDEFYKIASIDADNVILDGREQDWMTLDAGGTSVEYSIIHFPKKQVNVGFVVFDYLGRDGYDPVIREIFSEIDQNTAMVALSTPKSSGVQENVSQQEGISIEIETKDGETLKGDL